MTDGFYRLEFCADPFNEIKAENEDNNCIVNYIRLSCMSGRQEGGSVGDSAPMR